MAVKQAVGGKILVQLLAGIERGRGEGRPEHGRRTRQAQPVGDKQGRNVEGRKEDE